MRCGLWASQSQCCAQYWQCRGFAAERRYLRDLVICVMTTLLSEQMIGVDLGTTYSVVGVRPVSEGGAKIGFDKVGTRIRRGEWLYFG